MKKQEICKVVYCRKQAQNIYSLRFKSSHISTNSKPGQFVLIKTSNTNTPLLRRPFAIFNTNRKQKTFDVLFEVKGKGTKLLANKKKGDTIDIIGPIGNGFNIRNAKNIIIVAGGIGLASVNLLCNNFAINNKNVHLYYGARSLEYMPVNSFHKKIKTSITTDDGSYGQKKFVTEALKEDSYKFDKDYIVFACGPNIMLKKVYKICKSNNWKCFVSLESHMACGVGACNGCIVDVIINGVKGHKRVCKEGPVFNAGEIIWT